jgi:RNA polymerase-binding transcription factor DksA
VTYEQVEPRLFGVVPTLTGFLLGLTILVVALVVFALGHPVLGAILLVPAIGLLALSAEAARRFGRNDPASRAALRAREWSRFALASTAARSRASRDLLAARSELARLRAEFRRTQLELGDAAYREDAAETERLRARMRELEERAQAIERGTHRAVGEAEREIGEERLAIQPTEIVQPPPE